MKNTKKVIKSIIRTLGKNIKRPFVSALILAGGSSERMNGVSKQLQIVGSVPVVVLSAKAFDDCPDISEIVVVCKDDEKSEIEAMMQDYGVKKFKRTVTGGNTRFDSMKSGLEVAFADADYVAVHDAARCLITPEQISSVVAAAKKCGAAIAASKTTDTVKLVDEKGIIKSTVDRSAAWSAQTPQIFKKAMLEVGAYMRSATDAPPTDDAMLVEALGFKVAVVDCGYENIKITTPKDIAVASAILAQRRKKDE